MPACSEEISIVFQGPVIGAAQAGSPAGLTAEALTSARRVYADAEIVLSTWRETDVSGLDCDKVVFSDDPGGVKRADGRMNNVNRQIRSTLSGLQAATRKYAIKVRTDTIFTHSGAAELVGRHPVRTAAHRYFAERVIACEWFFRNPRRCPLLFHMGDIFQLGLRSDLLDLWDLPFEPAEHTQDWYQHFPRHSRFRWRMFAVPFRYCEEQYLWTSYLRKKGCDVSLDYPWQVAVPLTVASELSLINNFVIASAADLGIRLPDRLTKHSNFSTYSPAEWLALYERYCVARHTASCKAVGRLVQTVVLGRQAGYVINLPRRAWRSLLGLRKKKASLDANS
jgi:hypothetical protein